MGSLVVLEVMFVLCHKLARIAGQQLVWFQVRLDVLPAVYLLFCFVATMAALVHPLASHVVGSCYVFVLAPSWLGGKAFLLTNTNAVVDFRKEAHNRKSTAPARDANEILMAEWRFVGPESVGLVRGVNDPARETNGPREITNLNWK